MRITRVTRPSGEPVLATAMDGVFHRVRLDSGSPSVHEALGEVTDRHNLAPVAPSKVIGVGLNYATHADESGAAIPAEPITFAMHPSAICGNGDPIIVPDGVDDLDYEAELGVVIGRRVRDVRVDSALDVVLGYTCVNDVSARTIQLGGGQWTRGKSFDTFCPVGPHIVTLDEIPDPDDLAIRCVVDGETRQDDRTSNMVFSVAELIAFISRDTTLIPGDLICTGTPSGVAYGSPNPRWLEPGSTVTIEIEGVGLLSNPVVGEAGE